VERDEVIEEQRQIKAEFGDVISFESLKKSVKLENCVRVTFYDLSSHLFKETLRLLPPLIILMRKVVEPLKFRDYDLPVGDFLCISPGYGMRLSEVYTNPNSYDPHRFDRGEHSAVPYAYLAFGGGRYNVYN
jgi:sterol 14-demethylase